MTTDQNQKLEQLKKALGTNTSGEKIVASPSLDSQALPKKSSSLSFIDSKFDAGKNHNIKTSHDPKGKNKQILKGNSKARR